MSEKGLTATVLATTLSEAVGKDKNSEGHDMATGKFGEHTTQWIRDIAEKLCATTEPD